MNSILIALAIFLFGALAQLILFFSVRTGVLWHLQATLRRYALDPKLVLNRWKQLGNQLTPPSIAKLNVFPSRIEPNEGSDLTAIQIVIEGYQHIDIDRRNIDNIGQLLFDGQSSSQRISYFGLEIARLCLQHYAEHGDTLCRDAGIALIQKWSKDYVRSSLDPFTWYDHSVASRLVNSIYCAAVLNSNASREHRKLAFFLLREARACEKFLLSKLQYDWKTNHGLIADYNLVLASFLRRGGQLNSSDSVIYQRSLGRLDYFISDDGIVLEPATSYWAMVRNFYSKILGLFELKNYPVEEYCREKLEALNKSLSLASVEGQFARIGDSSGGNVLAGVAPHTYDADGVYSFATDAGLCYLTGVTNAKAHEQLFFNASYSPPLVHAHQDALAINLISEGVVWINSPGYFSPSMHEYGINIRAANRQSSVSLVGSGYQPKCKIDRYECGGTLLTIDASVDYGNEGLLKRQVSYNKIRATAQIDDSASSGKEVESRFLLDPNIDAELSENSCTLSIANKKLRLFVESDKVELIDAIISFERNKLVDTKMLVLRGSRNKLKFSFGSGQANIIPVASHTYPYTKRVPSISRPLEWIKRFLPAFHFQRLKKALTAQAILVILLTVIATTII